ncbi:hypothetical protein FGO68_gene3958 [Halteria grandinella]|uniref:VLRF1 domain-containing protein n=1 Tax=Halteria grandinella TaxID=5974 RepID=A0A8J8NPP0_HALGN|nr:hypothetical protein FGO68_gene3958 [Halteria grandinella]
MEQAHHTILLEESALYHTLQYLDKLNPLRLLNKGFTEKLEGFREWKAQQRKAIIMGSGMPTADGECSDMVEAYIAARELIVNSRVNKKNLSDLLSQESYKLAAPFKPQILSIKKSLVIKSSKQDHSQQTMAKTSVFDIPVQFWRSGITSFYFKDYPHTKITFAEFGKNRENYEFVKEFNRLNSYQPYYVLKNERTGDLFQVNKGFVMGVQDDDEVEQEGNKFQFLAESEEFSAKDIDFTDPTALLKRQKAILEAIHKHQNTEQFDPLRVLQHGIQHWVLILCHGGKFFLQVFQGSKSLFSKSDSKYVMRKKQGGRQMNKDKTAKIMSSVGSQMRRENERLLQEHIDEYMEEAKGYIEKADVIFLHAPGMNKTIFISQSKPLGAHMHKVRAIEFKSKKANYQEAVELIKKITEVKLYFNADYVSPVEAEGL